jgi:hypothetical protein
MPAPHVSSILQLALQYSVDDVYSAWSNAQRRLKSWFDEHVVRPVDPIMWTLYSPSLSSTTRLTVPPGHAA